MQKGMQEVLFQYHLSCEYRNGPVYDCGVCGSGNHYERQADDCHVSDSGDRF